MATFTCWLYFLWNNGPKVCSQEWRHLTWKRSMLFTIDVSGKSAASSGLRTSQINSYTRWLSATMKPPNSIARACLQIGPWLNPKGCIRMDKEGKRKQGLPKTTWWGTVTAELKEMDLTRGEAQHAAQDMSRWRQIVKALCPIREQED